MKLKVLRKDEHAKLKKGCSASSCGSNDDQLSHLPDKIREKIHNHPCYSEQAHHYFARMHVAVAPACNIQCHYCNRKYDCANESRPGVVSELLTPEQAVKKVKIVAATIPQMSVLGIAGPGDPLANPQRTFDTFRMLSQQAPDIKLCVSTNGLALPDAVEELCKYNIEHVTITINCVDAEIGARIYPWIFWNNRRIKGVEAARRLIEQQQKGLEMLVARGILVKVNSVMIPGVNEEHLKQVSKIVKQKGAFLHNVMPLIAEAEHGTFYGVMGQRSPNAKELQNLQDACSGEMNMMRHCRQCRADAVGLLGEDRGDEFTLDKIETTKIDYAAAMEKRALVHQGIRQKLEADRAHKTEGKVLPMQRMVGDKPYRPVLMAVATRGGGVINQHFGHAKEFLIYEASKNGVRCIGHRKVDVYCEGEISCGDDEGVLARTMKTLQGCEVVLCYRIGYEPRELLEQGGIATNCNYAMQPIEVGVLTMYQEMIDNGKLNGESEVLATEKEICH